ncbi:MAG: hypothetical protein R3C56_06565 [Pirellulaceae bacterium]
MSDGIAMASVAGTIGSFYFVFTEAEEKGAGANGTVHGFSRGNFVSAALAT